MLGSQFLFQAAGWEWALAGWGRGGDAPWRRAGGTPVFRFSFSSSLFCGAPRGTLSGALGAGVGKGGVVGWEAGGIREGLDK